MKTGTKVGRRIGIFKDFIKGCKDMHITPIASGEPLNSYVIHI
jgi:hypothetical protein